MAATEVVAERDTDATSVLSERGDRPPGGERHGRQSDHLLAAAAVEQIVEHADLGGAAVAGEGGRELGRQDVAVAGVEQLLDVLLEVAYAARRERRRHRFLQQLERLGGVAVGVGRRLLNEFGE